MKTGLRTNMTFASYCMLICSGLKKDKEVDATVAIPLSRNVLDEDIWC